MSSFPPETHQSLDRKNRKNLFSLKWDKKWLNVKENFHLLIHWFDCFFLLNIWKIKNFNFPLKQFYFVRKIWEIATISSEKDILKQARQLQSYKIKCPFNYIDSSSIFILHTDHLLMVFYLPCKVLNPAKEHFLGIEDQRLKLHPHSILSLHILMELSFYLTSLTLWV